MQAFIIINIIITGDVASSEMIKVLEPFDVFSVTEDEQKLVKFAKKNITCYNPRAGYGYYEFTEPCYVLPIRNVMALKKVIYHKISMMIVLMPIYNHHALEWRVIHGTRCTSSHWCYWRL